MNTGIYTHRDLDIWKKSIILVINIYALTRDFPSNEKFGIILQMRKSAVSVPLNIAEGAGRNSRKELAYFLSVAQGSLAELETQVIISKKLEFIQNTQSIEDQISSIRAMLIGLRRKILKTD